MAVLAGLFASAIAILQSCGSDHSGTPGAVEAGLGDGNLSSAFCPDASPTRGETCLLPEGTTCAFGTCGAIVTCSLGTWRFADNNRVPACPNDPPASGALCPPCWPEGATCQYPKGGVNCSSPDAAVNSLLASCFDGGWTIDAAPCREGGTPISDSGADVQGDGAADVD